MKSDYQMIVRKFPDSWKSLRIYPLGDLHIGAPEFDLALWDEWKYMVKHDDQGQIVIVGDMLENSLKTSVGNSYEAQLSPHEQKLWLANEFKPIKNKILGVTRGNHEYRSVMTSDDCPLYDVMAKLDLEDLYRENMVEMKVSLGFKNAERQWSYTVLGMHGASKNKTEKFSYALDGVDVFITGHTHDASARFPKKIVMDAHNEVIRMVGYMHVTVPSFMSFGGYALRGMYMPTDNKFPVIKLSGTEKKVRLEWV